MVPVPVDPLGGGDHGRRRCPPKVPGQRISSALYSELSASAGAKPKGVSLGPTEAIASQSARACP